MGWLDLPRSMRHGIGLANQNHRTVLDGTTSLNILGMGGSSMTPEVFSDLFPDTKPKLNVFDTVNPETVNDALSSIDLTTATFVVASKSGTTVEPLSLESVFRNALKEAGSNDVAKHFVAISDPDTHLATRVCERRICASHRIARERRRQVFGFVSFRHVPRIDLWDAYR